MNPHPKPPIRTPKPRRPMARRTPAEKAAKTRKVRARRTPCVVRGCRRRPRSAGYCLTHAKREADRLWSLVVRGSGEGCEMADRHPTFPCGGPIQAAHGFSRRYRGTRYVLLNGFRICAAAHRYWTERPLEWDELLRERWGEVVYEEMRRLALHDDGPDYSEVLAELQRRRT